MDSSFVFGSHHFLPKIINNEIVGLMTFLLALASVILQ
jgi:hypothetical protein